MWQDPCMLLLAATTALLSTVHAVDNVVDVGYAQYRGSVVDTGLGVSAWKGVQFAAPPVGKLRFAPPQDPVASGLIDATKNSGICPPGSPKDWTVTGNSSRFFVSEDCLYLSVYAPTNATVDSKLPVVVFFQGGGFTSMSSANWNPSEIVSAGQVVFVQFNYRIGMYGFLFSEEVVKGGGDVNAGIRDQIKVLEWVQKHITKFGGNPEHVVLDGVSAGGSSVALMMTADRNLNDKLFVGGIMESAGWVTMREPADGEEQYQCLLKDKGCQNATDGLACLRALNESAIRTDNCYFNPNIDGTLFTDSYINLLEQGKYVNVPTIVGFDADEGTKNAPDTLNTSDTALKWLTDKDPTLTNGSKAIIQDFWINQQQPVFPGKGAFWRQTAIAIGDISTFCMTRNIQNALVRSGGKTYSYDYAVRDPKDEASGLGAWHTVNAYAFWGTNRSGVPVTDGLTPASYFTGGVNAAIVSMVRPYWLSFIHTLDPNPRRAPGMPEWTSYDSPDVRQRLFIQTNNTKMTHMSDAQSLRCDVVGKMTENLLKPPPKGTVTDFDAALAAKAMNASESTDLLRGR